MSRSYFDISRTPKQTHYVIRGPDGVYRTLAGRVIGIDVPCEHCEGERSRKVRHDELRGFVCPPCDSALDEMLGEGCYAKAGAS